MFHIPGITGSRRLHESKFRRHGFADDHRPRLPQEPDNRGIPRGTSPGIEHRAVLRGHIRRIDDVFYANGDPASGSSRKSSRASRAAA